LGPATADSNATVAPTVAPSVAPTTAPVSVVTLIEAFITSSMENDRKHAAEIAELRTSQKIARKTTEELRQKSSKQEAELKGLREKINGLKINKCVSGSTKAKYDEGDDVYKYHTFKFDVVFTEKPTIMYGVSGLWNEGGLDAPSFWSRINSSSKSQLIIQFNVRKNTDATKTAINLSYIACGPVKRA